MLEGSVIDAQEAEEYAAADEHDDLGAKGELHRHQSQHAAYEVSDGVGDVVGRGIGDDLGAPGLGVRGVYDVVEEGGEDSSAEDAGEHPAADHLGLGLGASEDQLAHGVSAAADQDDGPGGDVVAEPSPEGGEQEVDHLHGCQSDSEHGAVKAPFDDEGRSHRVDQVGRDGGEYQSDQIDSEFLFAHNVLFLLKCNNIA